MITNYKQAKADVLSLYSKFLPIIKKVKDGKATAYDSSLESLKKQAANIKQDKFLLMIVGEAKSGKSTFINKVAKRKTAKTEDRPGVTRTKQWVPIDASLELMDTPGMLWPKFEDQSVGLNLAYTGAVRDEIMDIETLACNLMAYLGKHYPQALLERYKVEVEPEDSGYDLLIKAGRKRGFVIRGGEVDTERMAKILLDEFRGGKLGRISLERPDDEPDAEPVVD